MKRKWSTAALALAVCLLAGACAASPTPASPTPEPSPTPSVGVSPTPEPTPPPAPALAQYLPHDENHSWQYSGFAEYGHNMTLQAVEKEQGKWVYQVKGDVADMSDGEADSNLAIDLTYTVTDDALIQESNAPMMMDATYRKIELLRMPLEAGAKWQQQAVAPDGKEVSLDCTIEAIDEEDGKQTVTVRYDDKASGYYEKRVLMQDAGVVEFVKLAQPGGESFEMGYTLHNFVSRLTGAAKDAADKLKDAVAPTATPAQ